MSKQGGYQILPIPYGEDSAISWAEYKRKYGVDLDKVFEVKKTSESTYMVLQKTNKPLLLQIPYNEMDPVRVAYPNVIAFSEDDRTESYLTLGVRFGDSSEYNISIFGSKEVTYGEI